MKNSKIYFKHFSLFFLCFYFLPDNNTKDYIIGSGGRVRSTVGTSCMREEAGGKPAKTGGDVDAAAKERPEEAPFAALHPHDYRLRTWNRTPAAKPTRPNNY